MAVAETKTAFQIGYDLLEKTRDSLLAEDFDTFAECFFLPHLHVTVEGVAVLETEEDLRCIFDRVVSNYRRMGVDEIIRPLVASEFIDAHHIDSTAVSYIYARRKLINTPYPVRSELILSDGRWQIAAANYGVTLGSDGVAGALMVPMLPSEAASRLGGQGLSWKL